MSNDDVFIPCEFCQEMVRFLDYEEHVGPCSLRLQPHFLIYRDNDAVYRINLGPAIQAFNRLNVAIPESDGEDDTSIDDQGSPRRTLNHSSLIVMPRIIPLPPDIIQDDGSYEFNSLLSEVIGNVRVGYSNPTFLSL